MKGLFFLLLLIAAVWMLRVFTLSPDHRTTVIIAADPMVVASWDDTAGRLALVEIPAESTIEAVSGYGRYSLRALLELGTIDKKGGTVLAQSVQEALGLPVRYYLHPPGDGRQDVLSLFSWGRAVAMLTGQVETDMPFSTWIALTRRIMFLRPDHITTVTLAPLRGLATQTAPDGSSLLALDVQQVDVLLGALFENEEVRREALPVAVYNTTTMPTLGTRVGRMLSRLGYLVVTVDNDEPVVDVCEIRTADTLRKSASVTMLREILDCSLVIDETPQRADIVVRMGTQYARRFLPAHSP